MCKECFEDYLKVSGGQAADSALPPAFASAETQVSRWSSMGAKKAKFGSFAAMKSWSSWHALDTCMRASAAA